MRIYNDNEMHISIRTLERLPLYHHYLREILESGENFISTTHIADKLHLKPIQVRKDIASTGIIGKPKRGYLISESIERFLGWDTENKSVLIGCGNLGSSLLAYSGFKRYGLNIVMGFDNSVEKINQVLFGKPVYSVNEFAEKVKQDCFELAIIAVPEKYAQEAADLVVTNNIKAIWNFAPISLSVPDDVTVQQQDMAPCLAVLLNKIKLRKQCKKVSFLD